MDIMAFIISYRSNSPW